MDPLGYSMDAEEWRGGKRDKKRNNQNKTKKHKSNKRLKGNKHAYERIHNLARLKLQKYDKSIF